MEYRDRPCLLDQPKLSRSAQILEMSRGNTGSIDVQAKRKKLDINPTTSLSRNDHPTSVAMSPNSKCSEWLLQTKLAMNCSSSLTGRIGLLCIG